jgi:hypothetical protein
MHDRHGVVIDDAGAAQLSIAYGDLEKKVRASN